MIRMISLRYCCLFYAWFCLGIICCTWQTAFSASIQNIQNMNFGTIIADPSGDVIEINAAGGTATPVLLSTGNAIVTGGTSGRITIYSDLPNQTITLDYPLSFTLSQGASTMTVDGILARSQFFATSAAVGDIHFHIGGLLHINAGQGTNPYSGTMNVTVTIVNP